jgi:uncharacterized protein (TIGR02118 family)
MMRSDWFRNAFRNDLRTVAGYTVGRIRNADSPLEAKMTVKLVVLYPYPKDVAAFETAYMNEHVRLVAEKVPGVTQYVLSRSLGAPEETQPFYLIAELYFPSVEALQAGFSPQVA